MSKTNYELPEGLNPDQYSPLFSVTGEQIGWINNEVTLDDDEPDETELKRRRLSGMITEYQYMSGNENAVIPVDIIWETGEEVGLSTLEMMRICGIHQMPGDGLITFQVYGCEEDFDLDDYPELIQNFINYLEEEFDL